MSRVNDALMLFGIGLGTGVIIGAMLQHYAEWPL